MDNSINLISGPQKQTPAKEVEEDNEEEEQSEASSSEEDESPSRKAQQALTGRKVTLNNLMEDGVIEAGEGVLTIDYLGQKFEADLLPSGRIKWQGSEEEFGTPSAWALHCKKLVNPIKRSGCGWASVKYKNKKLDIWKSIWARKQRQSTNSKSPQISPGPRPTGSASATPTDHNRLSPAIASPRSPKGFGLGSTGSTSPIASTTAASTSPSKAPSDTSIVSFTSSSSTISPAATTTTAANDTKLSSSSSSSPSAPTPTPAPSSSSTSASPPSLPVAPTCKESERNPTPDARGSSTAQAPCQASPAGGVAGDQGSSGVGAGDKVPETTNHDAAERTAEEDNHSPVKKAKLEETAASQEPGITTPSSTPPSASSQRPNTAIVSEAVRQEVAAGLDHRSQPLVQHQPQGQQQLSKKRQSVAYSSLGQRGLDVDPLTLIKCKRFDSLSKIQPFTVSVTSNSLLLMDFHCHMTQSEVVGYLGGKWDCQRQHLSIEQAFPCKCRLGDKDRAGFVEEEIQRSMRQKGLMIVGWYHSHPDCPPDPTLRDLDCQMAYQLRMRGSSAIYLPCVGFIVSPFEKYPPRQDSKIQAFWVMPNLEHPTSFNIPMHVAHSVVRDLSLTEDLLSDFKSLCEFYSGAVDKVHLKKQWGEAITYMDKIKASLRSKLPEDQLDSSTFLDYVQQLMGDMK